MELDYGPNGYLTTQGRNAVEGREAYNRALEELKKKHAPKVGLVSQKYNDAATEAVTAGMKSGIIHSAQGMKDFAASSSTARLSLYQDQALAGYDKPDQIKKSLGLGFAEIDEQAKLMGWGPDVVQVKRQQFSSQVHTNVALAMASKPAGARAALTYIKARASMTSHRRTAWQQIQLRSHQFSRMTFCTGVRAIGQDLARIKKSALPNAIQIRSCDLAQRTIASGEGVPFKQSLEVPCP